MASNGEMAAPCPVPPRSGTSIRPSSRTWLRPQPFLDQAEDELVADAMFEGPGEPTSLLTEFAEELLQMYRRRQCNSPFLA